MSTPNGRSLQVISTIPEISLTILPTFAISSFIERISHATRQQDFAHTLGQLDPGASYAALRLARSALGELSLMDSNAAVSALSALAQEHRLNLFRLLVQAGEEGMAAGALAEALSVPNSSLSFHLAHLTRAGLIGQRREGRSLIYTANYQAMNALVGYLTENCCSGADCSPAALPSQPAKRKSA